MFIRCVIGHQIKNEKENIGVDNAEVSVNPSETISVVEPFSMKNHNPVLAFIYIGAEEK